MWRPEDRTEMEVDEDGERIEEYDEGKELRKTLDAVTVTMEKSGDLKAAVVGYLEVLHYESTDTSGQSDSIGKVKEEAIYCLAKTYAKSKRYLDWILVNFSLTPRASRYCL